MKTTDFQAMANEEDIESFDVSERDLYDAFQPGQRRSKKLTKNQHIYGVFDDEEDYHVASSSSNMKSSRKQDKDYQMPVDFVKGGVQQNVKQLNAASRNQDFR